MEVYEIIVSLLKQKNLSKRDFANMLIERDIRSKRTGEVVSEKIVYAYLNGSVSLRAEMIPLIANILGVTEQELFDDTEAKRVKILKKILKNPSELEKKTAILLLKENTKSTFYNEYQLNQLAELLNYAPPLAIEHMIKTLEKYKKVFDEI